MILAVDIGNSDTVIGVFDGEALARHWRIATSRVRTSDEYGVLALALLSSAALSAEDVEGAVICSVVPDVNRTLGVAVLNYMGIKPRFVGDDIVPDIPVLTDNPAEVGHDRLVNAVAARAIYGTPVIVVDFGTATTFDYITAGGEYAGGVIAPGIGTSAEALYSRTAKLPRVDPKRPERVIGKNTLECMRSGLFFGFLGLVDGILDRMTQEVRADKVVATGGLYSVVMGESRTITDADEFLTLKGLRILYEKGK